MVKVSELFDYLGSEILRFFPSYVNQGEAKVSKSPKNNVRPNESNQDKIRDYLRIVEALDSPQAAESFRKAYPDHALSKPFRSRKQQRRHGK